MFPAFLESLLDDLAPGDSLFQRPVRGGKVNRAPAQPLAELTQPRLRPERGRMGILDWADGLGEEKLRALDNPIPTAGGFECAKCALVNPRHVQRLQPERHRLPSPATGWTEARMHALLQVLAQCRGILL